MNAIEEKVIEAALRKMFDGGYFSICTIDSILKIIRVPQGGKTYELLQALHCVRFADMDRDLAQAVMGMIGEVLQGVTFDVGDMMRKRSNAVNVVEMAETKAEPRSGILRSLGLK